MIRIVVDTEMVRKLDKLAEPLELCDPSGRVLARAIPVADISDCEPVSLEITEEELRRRMTSGKKRFTTREVMDHLGRQ